MVSMNVFYVHVVQQVVRLFGGIQKNLLVLQHYCKHIGLLQTQEISRKELDLKSLMMPSVFIDVMG